MPSWLQKLQKAPSQEELFGLQKSGIIKKIISLWNIIGNFEVYQSPTDPQLTQ